MYLTINEIQLIVSVYRDCDGSFFVTPEPERPCVTNCLSSTTCLVADVPDSHLRVS